jgi:hypothetical protein
MKKMIIAAMVLLLIQLGLTLAFYMGNKGIDAEAADTLFLTFSPDAVHSLKLSNSEGKSVVLEKAKGGWVVPAHFSAPVDQNKVKVLLDKLAKMKKGFVVATSADAAKRFKVDNESFENHVVLKGAEKPLADFYVGTSPAFRQVHARREGSDEIVVIPLSSFELESSSDKWLDTSLATIKDDDLIGLSFAEFKLKKSNDGWQLEGLKDGEKINQKEVDALATKARGLIVQDVLDPAKVSALFDHPVFRFSTVKKGGEKVEYLFAKGKDDFYVLKLSDRNIYLKVQTQPVDALQKVTREKLVEVAKMLDKSSEADVKK